MQTFLAASVVAVFLPMMAMADALVAARAIRAGDVLQAEDLEMSDLKISGSVRRFDEAIGRQASRNLFPGRAIFAHDLQDPHIVDRNQEVSITYHSAGLSIVVSGRALDGGAVGDSIRVLNASSRKTVIGTVLIDGTISVTGLNQ